MSGVEVRYKNEGLIEPLPPYDEGAEEATLGAMLSSPRALALVASALRPADFYKLSNGVIFDVLLEMHALEESVDVVTACAALDRKGLLEEVHGRGYLHTLVESVPVITNAGQYATRVKELARQRELLDRLYGATQIVRAPGFDGAASQALRRELDTCDALLTDGGGEGPSLPLYTGRELAEMHCDEPEAICEGLLYRGCSTDMVAEPKRGKTTVALSVSRAIVGGGVWCGRRTRKVGVLYLTEQSPHSFSPQCGRAGLLGEPNFHTLFHRDALALSWPEIGEFVVREAKARGLSVVFIDNLSLWAGIAGDEENEAGVALQTLRVIERMTGAGLAVLAIRHARKSGGSINEAGRGSSAIAGGFDILVQVKGDKAPQRRIIEATGRVFAQEPLPLVVELGADHRFHYVREGGRTSAADASAAILGQLARSPEEAAAEGDIIAGCQAAGVGKPMAQQTLRVLCDEKNPEHCISRAKGVGAASAHAYGYWRCSDA